MKEKNHTIEPSSSPQHTGAATDEALAAAADELRIAELEAHLKDATNKALRVQAELENYRKRAQRELADERRYAVVPLVRDLLPVFDNLQRAIDASQQSTDGKNLLEGVQMVAAQLEAVLQQHGCVRIETVGAAFDPNQHEAIAQEPSNEHPAGTITRATQVGYKLHDRVIRPAQVFVSTGAPK
jgi:molecular chaperone GrpE